MFEAEYQTTQVCCEELINQTFFEMRRIEIFESLDKSKFQKLERDKMKTIVGGGEIDTYQTTQKKKDENDGVVCDKY